MAEYKKGHHPLEIFDATMEGTPRWVKIWIVLSTAWFLCGLFFVWQHSIARWVVGCHIAGLMALVASSIFNSVLVKLSGFNALAHIVFWSPALFRLLTEQPFFDGELTAFSIWSGGVTAIMLFSFVFDVPYSFVYLRHVLFRK
ncbi:MAG: hypothetical protein AAFN77_23645 [Planctomycetota bacterium]